MLARRIKTCAAMVLAMACAGCASFGDGRDSTAPVSPDWRLVPEATVIGQRRQFFLYGRHLDSAQVTVPPSIHLEKGTLKPDGHVLALYMTVSALRLDSLAKDEKPGTREVRIKTPDTTAAFTLKVVDEVQPH